MENGELKSSIGHQTRCIARYRSQTRSWRALSLHVSYMARRLNHLSVKFKLCAKFSCDFSPIYNSSVGLLRLRRMPIASATVEDDRLMLDRVRVRSTRRPRRSRARNKPTLTDDPVNRA